MAIIFLYKIDRVLFVKNLAWKQKKTRGKGGQNK